MDNTSEIRVKKHPTHQQVPHPKPAQTLLKRTSGSSKSVPVEVPAPSTHVKPGDNFYLACNANWLRKTSLPSYKNTYSVSEELEDYLEGFLFQIAQDATAVAKRGIAALAAAAKAEDAIGRLVLAAMRPEKQRFSVETLKGVLRGHNCLVDRAAIARRLGQMIAQGIPTLLDVTIDSTFLKGGLTYCLQITPGSLGLLDPRYYLSKEAAGQTLKAATILREYGKLLKAVAQQFDLGEGLDLATAIATEISLADPLLKAEDDTNLFIVPFKELQRQCKAIPWAEFMEGLGIQDLVKPADYVGILSLPWLKIVDSLFGRLPVEQWRPLLAAHTATHGLQFLPPPYDQQHFALYGKLMLGQAKKIPQHILTMNVLRTTMSDSLSYLFIKRFIAVNEKAKATAFVETLRAAAERRLKGTTWLEPASRKALVQKVAAMKACVFYPEPVKAPKGLPDLHTERFLEAIYALNAARLRRAATDRLGPGATKPGDTWDEPVFTVNAYYYPDSNQIVLPAGYFFWPFYDAGRLGWSYGGLGVIIGHEILHAFDEEGKEIDEHGRRRPLWSAADQRAYQKRLNALIDLYSKAKVGGVHVNGEATASENLADLGGLAIALDALEFALAGRPAQDRLRELREFFWSYAVSWRTKQREKKALQAVFMDKHAPPEIRVNYVVAQFDAWYEAFSIVTGDDMYVPPEERLRIF